MLRRWRLLFSIASLAMLTLILAWPAGAQDPAIGARRQWLQLIGLAREAYQAGDYPKGIQLAEQAFRLARQRFGNRDPNTLLSLNDLGFLYRSLGRCSEAEPLYREALQGEPQDRLRDPRVWAPYILVE